MTDEAIKKKALALLREQDSLVAIHYLSDVSDPLAAGDAFMQTMLYAYWQQKDLPATIVFGRAGSQYCLHVASTCMADETERAYDLASTAKGMTYNLAAFTWPGWDEPGITITDSDISIGYDAAKANLRLAHELEKDDLRLGRAYWMLGAQEMAIGSYATAAQTFLIAADHAGSAESGDEQLLNLGYSVLAGRLLAPESAELASELADLQAQLREFEHGKDLEAQLDTAFRVFSEA